MAQQDITLPIRACIFDMDGLLINSEDLYVHCDNQVFAKYGKPPVSWSVRAKVQGRNVIEGVSMLLLMAGLTMKPEDFITEVKSLQEKVFLSAQPLAGVPELLAALEATRSPRLVHLALATSSFKDSFALKTSHLSSLFSVFPEHRRILGDDHRLGPGRGKPNPDIFLLALQAINDSLPDNEELIQPYECLVLEDSVVGVEAASRAGMRVIWCPHPELRAAYTDREEEEILNGCRNNIAEPIQPAGHWAESVDSLLNFPYEKYGLRRP